MARLRVTMEIKCPIVPNFLILSDGQSVPLSAVTEEGLREIAAMWTENLIKRAREQSAAAQATAKNGEPR